MNKLATIFIVLLSAASLLAQGSGEVIITEIMYNANSSESNTQTQFVELVNTTGSAINLENWTIDDEDGDGPNTLPNVTIPAFGILVVCGSSAADFQGAFGATFAVTSLLDNGETMINLSNSPSATSEIISLRDASNQLVDEVNFDDGSGWPSDSPDGVSIYLSIDKSLMNATSNDDGANWSRSTVGVDGGFESTPFGVWDSPEIASPGNIAGDIALPVELSSFAAIGGDKMITLSWTTASELENQGFAILRAESKDGDYLEIDSYQSNDELKGAGTSAGENSYRYVDNEVFNGTTYWYKLVDIDLNGTRTEHGPKYATAHSAGVVNVDKLVPTSFELAQNKPNPFNPSTVISFNVPELREGAIAVSLTVYNALGQKVVTLFDGLVDAGVYEAKWNGKNAAGNYVPSGVYIYQIVSENYSHSKRMTLVK